MALAPALDLRDPRDVAASLPRNIEAEQGLIGALLYDGTAIHRLPERFGPEHFFEPFHGRLFTAIARAVRLGIGVDATLLAEQFRADVAYKELGADRYLADLIDNCPPAARAGDYGLVLIDLAQRRDLIRTAQELAHRAATEFDNGDGEDVTAKTLADALQHDLTAIQLQHPKDRLTPIGEAAMGVYEAVSRGPDTRGVTSGVAPLDLALGKLMPGDLVLLAARPSMGKSAVAGAFSLGVGAPFLVDEIMERDTRLSASSHGVIEVHGEMSWGEPGEGGQQARRHVSNLGFHLYGDDFPAYSDMRSSKIAAHKLPWIGAVAQEFEHLPIVGIKRTGLRLSGLRSLVRRQAAEWERVGIDLGLVIVDHVGLLRPDGRTSGRYEAQTEIAIGLKELADEIKVPILGLVQLSRDIERRDDKRPQLADLRDSGAWEENADAVVMLYRDAYYAAREKEPNPDDDVKHSEWEERTRSRTIEMIVAKRREGGAAFKPAMGWIDLAHNALRGVRPESKGGMFG